MECDQNNMTKILWHLRFNDIWKKTIDKILGFDKKNLSLLLLTASYVEYTL